MSAAHDDAHPNALMPLAALVAPAAGPEPETPSSQRRRTASNVLAGVITGDQSLLEILHLIAELAVTTVDGIDEASVTVYREGTDRTGHTAGFAGPNAAALDERQYETGVGPCLQAAKTGQRVLLPSTRAGQAGDFEDFAYHARRAGVASATCLPLGVPGRVVGALNTFTHVQTPDAERGNQLDEQPGRGPLQGAALAAAEAFAAAAAVVVASAANVAAAREAAQNMQAAMEYRAVIEQAKGVLIAQHGYDPEGAFRELRRISQRDNVKLRQVATDVVVAAVNGGQGRAASDGPHA